MSIHIGVIVNPNDTLQIVSPAKGFSVQDNFDRMGVTGGHIVLRTDKPDTSIFFSSWRYDAPTNSVYVDVEVAKNGVIEANKKDTDKKLAALQPALEVAIDDGDTVTEQAVRDERRAIRSDLAAKIITINVATTEQELKDLMP